MRTTVHTSDNIPLAVRIEGPPTTAASATVVFVHGFCLNSTVWDPQRRFLARTDPSARMVFYDHRGHGHSGEADARTYTLDQLGHDLTAVIDATAPVGPLILIGHSMGGMAVLAHLRLSPATRHRLVGLALLSTAADDLTQHGIGRALTLPGLGLLPHAARIAPRMVQCTWGIARRLIAPAIGWPCSSRPTPSGPLAAAAHGCALISTTPAATITGFLPALRALDEAASVSCIPRVPTLVMCGTGDAITPPAHAQRLAQLLDTENLVLISGAQHLLGWEHPRLVAQHLSALLGRATHRPLPCAAT